MKTVYGFVLGIVRSGGVESGGWVGNVDLLIQRVQGHLRKSWDLGKIFMAVSSRKKRGAQVVGDNSASH